MAKPIEGIPVFRGKAAKWLTAYLETHTRPDPVKQERARQDAKLVKKYIKPLRR